MINYMDVLTILLIFFIAVAAQLPARPQVAAAQLPAGPQVAAAQSPAGLQVAAAPPSAPATQHTPLSDAQKTLEKSGIDVKMEARGLVISLPQQILFASGEDRVSADALPMVDEIARVIRDVPNRVSLIGHADSVPIHNRKFANNWELSAARGLRLLELLTGRYAIAEARLTVSSDGTNRPRGSNETKDGRASNRRVEIVLLAEEPVAN
jgi:chemotaxis protein MotB